MNLLADECGCRAEVAAVTHAAMAGEIDFEEALRRRVSLLAGLDEAVLDKVRRSLQLTPGARTLVRTPDPEKLAAAIGVDAIITPGGDGDVYVTGADAAAIGDAAQRAGIAIHQLITVRPDLEDAFLELTRARAAIR